LVWLAISTTKDQNRDNAIRYLKSIVAKKLTDPDSAKFRDATLYRSLRDDGGPPGYTLCGEVNTRNKFGGYTGFTSFIAYGYGWADDNHGLLDPDDSLIYLDKEVKYQSFRDLQAGYCKDDDGSAKAK
jgi:hypothetical protein